MIKKGQETPKYSLSGNYTIKKKKKTAACPSIICNKQEREHVTSMNMDYVKDRGERGQR